MGYIFEKRFSVFFSILILLQQCQIGLQMDGVKTLTVGSSYKTSINSDHLEWRKVDDLQENDNHFLSDNGLILQEDELDKSLKEISEMFHSSQKSKRVASYLVVGISAILTGVFSSMEVICPSYKKMVKKVQSLKSLISEERRQINLDWGEVDSKTRFLQRLTTDIELLRKSIEKMDELKRDIVTLIDPTVISKIEKLRLQVKEQIRNANATAKISIENAGKMQRDQVIAFGILMAGQVGSFGALMFIRYNAILYRNKMIASVRLGNFRAAKVVSDRKIAISNRGTIALVALSLIFSAIRLIVTTQKCDELMTKLRQAEKESYDALNNLDEIRDNMNTLNNMTDGNYTIMWNDLAGNDLQSFVQEAIDTAKGNENKTAKSIQSIKDMETFYQNFRNTKSSDGKYNYIRIEMLTRKLLEGFLDGNHNINCYRKKTKIIKIITDRCAEGKGTFAELWEMSKQMDKLNLQKCIVDHNYVSQESIKKIIKISMQKNGKQEICIRNNKLKKMIICNAYLNDESNLVNKVSGLSQEDVDFFTLTCPLPSVNENLRNLLCKLKEDNTSNKTAIFKTHHKINQTSLVNTWNNCPLSKAQNMSICASKQQGISLYKISLSFTNYKKAEIQAVYNSCKLKITPLIEGLICKFHNNPIASTLMQKYRRNYGSAEVDEAITKCKT